MSKSLRKSLFSLYETDFGSLGDALMLLGLINAPAHIQNEATDLWQSWLDMDAA